MLLDYNAAARVFSASYADSKMQTPFLFGRQSYASICRSLHYAATGIQTFFFQMTYFTESEIMLLQTRNISGADLLWQKVRTQDEPLAGAQLSGRKCLRGWEASHSLYLGSSTFGTDRRLQQFGRTGAKVLVPSTKECTTVTENNGSGATTVKLCCCLEMFTLSKTFQCVVYVQFVSLEQKLFEQEMSTLTLLMMGFTNVQS